MKISLEKDINKISPDNWNDLVQLSPTRSIFQTYEWHHAWWTAFHKDKELYIILFKNEDRLVGIAPYYLCKKHPKKFILRFMGYPLSDYCDIIYDKRSPEIIHACMAFLKKHKQDWHIMELNHIPGHSSSIAPLLSACRSHELHPLKTNADRCPALQLKKDMSLTKQIIDKKRVRNRQNYYIKKGDYSILYHQKKEDILKFLKTFYQYHIDRYSLTQTPSYFHDPCFRRFYETLLEECCEKKWILFSVLQSENTPAAFDFGFLYNNTYLCYTTSFDTAQMKRSPGSVLLKEILKYAVENDLDEFDFSQGDEGYKSRFTNIVRMNNSFVIYKKRIPCLLHRLFLLAKKTVKESWAGKHLHPAYMHLKGWRKKRVIS